MNRIKQLLSRIDELNLRERAMVFSAVLVVLFLGWYTYLMEPLMKEQQRLLAELSGKRNQQTTLNGQFEQLAARAGTDPEAESRRRIAGLNQQIMALEQDLKAATANLVAPEAMPEILRLVLNRSRGLTLMKLSGLGSTPLVMKTGAADGTALQRGAGANGDLGAAFKHGLRIEFRGDFFETLDYLRALEGLQQGFFWDRVTFAVQDYPDSLTTLTLYTLSLNPDWITI
jgi:MSHA biogenesis protein MshJ